MQGQNQEQEQKKKLDPMVAARRIVKILEPFPGDKAAAVLTFVQALRQ